jgi:hypothetical protein
MWKKVTFIYLFIYALLKDTVTASDYETPNGATVSE